MRILLFLSAAAMLAFGCRTSQKASGTEPVKVLSILHGTSFGHCRGYCIKEEFYNERSMTYTQLNRDSANFPKKVIEQPILDGDFAALAQTIDWQKWNALEKVIGCPDCADGGAEYIEIATDKGTKRVMFDAWSDPDGLKELLSLLREKRKLLEREEKNAGDE